MLPFTVAPGLQRRDVKMAVSIISLLASCSSSPNQSFIFLPLFSPFPPISSPFVHLSGFLTPVSPSFHFPSFPVQFLPLCLPLSHFLFISLFLSSNLGPFHSASKSSKPQHIDSGPYIYLLWRLPEALVSFISALGLYPLCQE